MELFITFSGDRIQLPLASSEIIQGLIYHALRADPAYARQLHEAGSSAEGRAFKLFCFSELSGRHEVEGKQITYLSHAHLQIRSAQPYFVGLLFSYFSQNSVVRLGDNTVKVERVRLGETHIFENSAAVRTLSPITVYMTQEDGHTTYFSPDDSRFYSAICANARRKWISAHGSEEGFALTVRPAPDGRFTRRCTRFKNTFITAWHGAFLLEGSPRTLDFLYQTGLGAKNSQGFGMFEIKKP